jgi:hypothetical protein
MKKTLMISLFGVALAWGQKELTVMGLVVDTGCYMSHNTKGEKHIKCATACAKAGVPLAILDEASGTLYLPVAVNHKNQNERLMPFIEKKVKVTGSLMEKGGIKGFAIKTVEAAP